MINLEKGAQISQILKKIRAFFDERKFQEMEIPVFNTALPLEPNLHSFKTEWQAVDKVTTFYLPASPESYLKKCLAAGSGNCYAIGHSFRNLEGAGPLHSPEFLMLEWYREDATYIDIMQDTEELVSSFLPDVSKKWERLSLEKMFLEYAGINMQKIVADETYFYVLAKEKGYATEGATWGALFDQIFLNEIESHLPKDPCFLVDFPARMSPLCKVNVAKPYLTERFEVFINRIELGNGNTENTDARQVREMMNKEQEYRMLKGLAMHPIDEEFIAALNIMAKTGKQYAGIGIGVERLAMQVGKSKNQ